MQFVVSRYSQGAPPIYLPMTWRSQDDGGKGISNGIMHAEIRSLCYQKLVQEFGGNPLAVVMMQPWQMAMNEEMEDKKAAYYEKKAADYKKRLEERRSRRSKNERSRSTGGGELPSRA